MNTIAIEERFSTPMYREEIAHLNAERVPKL
jgi:hypothetical protein